jgi:hypothetical protein
MVENVVDGIDGAELRVADGIEVSQSAQRSRAQTKKVE